MSALRQAARQLGRLVGQQGDAQASRAAGQCGRRAYASGGHGHHDSVTYEGLTIHKPASWHVYAGQGFAGLMWFWVFYRLYNDWDTFIHGHAAHFEHELHEGEHGHGGEGEHGHEGEGEH
eukprot:scaffold12.g8109.t1